MKQEGNFRLEHPENYRPSFAIYHPNPRGTGCAMKLTMIPAFVGADGDVDGCIMMKLARQRPVGAGAAGEPHHPSFDWENAICVKLGFNDLCKMLQVFRGECETLEDGRGLFHRAAVGNSRIFMKHSVEPVAGYTLDVYRNVPGRTDADVNAHMHLYPWEALGVSLAFENSFGTICFGIPKVLERELSGGVARKEAGDAAAA